MTPERDTDLLEQAGRALYGRDFPAQLAEALGVNRRSVHRWRAGDHPVPPGVWRTIASLLQQRLTESTALVLACERAAAERN